MRASTPSAQLTRLVAASEARRRWRALVLLSILAAVWGATTMTAVAGARRTASAVDRFQRVTHTSDASFSVSGDRSGRQLLRLVEATPEVASADLVHYVSTGLAFDDGHWVHVLTGQNGRWGTDFDRPVVLQGRLADPASPTEVTVTPTTASLLDVGPGDSLAIPTWDRDEWNRWWETRGAYPPFNGPLIDVDVVGVVRLDSSLRSHPDADLVVLATPAWLEAWDEFIGAEQPNVVVDLTDPATDPELVARTLSADMARTVDVTSTEDAYARHARDATRALAIGLTALAIAAAVTGGLMVGLAVSRESRGAASRHLPLRALGVTASRDAVALSIPIAAAGAGAAVVASVAAGAASALFPIGPGRNSEPTPGMWLDTPVLAGSVLIAVTMATTSFVTLRRPRRRHLESWRASTLLPRVVARSGPALLVGHSNAFRARERRPTIMIAAIALAGLTSTAWFAVSLDALADEPERWGYTWTFAPESGFPVEEFDSRVDATLADPVVAGISRIEFEVANIAGRGTSVSTFRTLGGTAMTPMVIDGRLPEAPLEIALGEATARDLRVDVGDIVSVDASRSAPLEWTVVGTIVPPALATSGSAGDGAYTTVEGHETMFENPRGAYLAFQLEPGVDVAAEERRLADEYGWRLEARSRPTAPEAVANRTAISVVLPWLIAYFVALGIGATALTVARRGSRLARDQQTLHFLGMSRRGLRRCSLVESLLIVAVGMVVGLPAGLIAGRSVWRLLTENLGVIDTQPTPWGVVVAVTALVMLVAVIMPTLAIHRAPAPTRPE